MSDQQQIHEAANKIGAALAGYPRSAQIAAVEHNLLMEDLIRWSNGDMNLEKNDCSRLHKLVDANRHRKIVNTRFEKFPNLKEFDATVPQTFVVKHDWSAALEGAEGIAADFRLPYITCAFEFRISGRTIIAIADDTEAHIAGACFISVFTEIGDLWCGIDLADEITSKVQSNVGRFVCSQIRAICIALDAEVATHSVMRAPARLNEKRTKAGKAPLLDFHVVDLARKHRIANPAHGDSGTKKRLHFRRGHWRHYETSKTWVKWCLVGDPDLGFISKHYSL